MKLYLSDWLYNAGLLGLYNALKNADKKIRVKDNYLEFKDDVLDEFEEDYFNYLIEKNNSNLTSTKIVDRVLSLERFEKDKLTEKNIDEINEIIKYTKEKITSNSYTSAFQLANAENDVEKIVKELKAIKVKKNKDISESINDINFQLTLLKKIKTLLENQKVIKYVKAKNVMYDIIEKFWSGVGILHTSKSKDDMYEVYKNYFLDSTKSYNNLSKGKYWCISCDNPITTLKSPNSYTLSWLEKIGADMNKKSSHFWNLNGDSYICPICNLVYSCIPLGFNYILGKGIFINNNSSMNMLIKINSTSKELSNLNQIEEQCYFNILDELQHNSVEKNKFEIDNIQVVKYDSENSQRPYTFNLLSKDKLEVINKHKNILKSLIKFNINIDGYYINLYREVLTRLYKNSNMYDLVYVLLKTKNMKNDYILKSILKLNITISERGEKHIMASYSKIDRFTKYGQDIKTYYTEKKAENKISGISYRLLNALKVNNADKFMDTVINAYMYLNKPMPSEFSSIIFNEDEFKTMGYSFVVGLQSIKKEDDNKEECK